MPPRSRGGSRPSLADRMALRMTRVRVKCRVLAAPMACLQKKMQAAVTTGSAETSGIPHAVVLTFIRDHPGDRLVCPRRLGARRLADLTSAPGGQDHTISSPQRPALVSRRPSRPPHPRLTCRDDWPNV